MKKIILFLLVITMMIPTTITAKEEVKDGIVEINGQTYYYQKGEKRCSFFYHEGSNTYFFRHTGEMAKDVWLIINGENYYFDNDGIMAKGMKTIDGFTYLFTDKGVQRRSCFYHEGENIYYFRFLGNMAKDDWLTINGEQYYFDKNGAMVLGLKERNGKTYYLSDKGMKKSWFYHDGSNTYFFRCNGEMAKDVTLTIVDKIYFFDESGRYIKGLYKKDDGTYYINDLGKYEKDKFIEIDNEYYYFDKYGRRVEKQGWLEINNRRYYLDDKGRLYRGIQEIDGYTYYFNEYGECMRSYFLTMDNSTYYLKNDYTMAKDNILEINNKRYYFDENGKYTLGLYKKSGMTYFMKDNVVNASDEWIKIDGKLYYFSKAGSRVEAKGWLSVGSKSYYISEDASALVGEHQIDGIYYYFEEDGSLFKNGFKVFDGKTYYYGSDGTKARNKWCTINGSKYYFFYDGMMATGVVKMNNLYYHFQKNGKYIGIENAGWSMINGQRQLINTEGKVVQGAKKLILDLSEHNGTINWPVLKNNVDGVILRAGYVSGREDYKFDEYVAKCEEYDIPYGIYVYSYALDSEYALEEARLTLNSLKGLNPSLPIYLDMEDADGWKRKQGFPSKETLVNICKVYCDEMIKNGYECGIYASLSWLDGYLNDPKLDAYPKWVAQWNTNAGTAGKCTYKKPYQMWQYTSNGHVEGISGRVDANAWYGE